MMSSGPHNWRSASSTLVPAVFRVFRKMNLCSCEKIMQVAPSARGSGEVCRPLSRAALIGAGPPASAGLSLALLRELVGEVLEDRAKMDFRHAERGGDVLELFALFAGDAVVGQEHAIGALDDLFLDAVVERLCRCGELGERIALGERLCRLRYLIGAERLPRLVAVDLLDQPGLARVKPAIGSRDRDHRLEHQVVVLCGRLVRHSALPLVLMRPDCARTQPLCQAAHGRKTWPGWSASGPYVSLLCPPGAEDPWLEQHETRPRSRDPVRNVFAQFCPAKSDAGREHDSGRALCAQDGTAG